MELYEQIVEANEANKEVIPHHPLAVNLLGLASTYLRQGWYEKAEPLILRGLAQSEEVLLTHRAAYPEDAAREVVVSGLVLLGRLRREQGLYEETESLLQRALALCQQSNVHRHAEREAGVLFELAILEELQGNIRTAEQHFLESLVLFEQYDIPRISKAAFALAKLSIRQGDNEKAEPLLQRALALRERQFGHTYAETLEVLHVYLTLLRKMGREETATHIEEQWR